MLPLLITVVEGNTLRDRQASIAAQPTMEYYAKLLVSLIATLLRLGLEIEQVYSTVFTFRTAAMATPKAVPRTSTLLL